MKKNKINKEETMWPVRYNNKDYYYKDCNKIFRDMYEFKEQLNIDGAIYLTEGIGVYPNGDMGEYW